MSELPTHTEVQLDSQGRLVIPVSLQRLLNLEAGDTLVACFEEGRLVLEKQETIRQRLKSRFANLPRDRSLANELVAERRAEAAKEIAE